MLGPSAGSFSKKTLKFVGGARRQSSRWPLELETHALPVTLGKARASTYSSHRAQTLSALPSEW